MPKTLPITSKSTKPIVVFFSPSLDQEAPQKTRYFNSPANTDIKANIFVEADSWDEVTSNPIFHKYNDCARVGLLSPKDNLIVRISSSGELILDDYRTEQIRHFVKSRHETVYRTSTVKNAEDLSPVTIPLTETPEVANRDEAIGCYSCPPLAALKRA